MSQDAASLRCLYCGEPEYVAIRDMWDGGEFCLDTCCEGLHEAVVESMQDSPEERLALLRALGAEDYAGQTLRRVADCDGLFLLDWQLEIRSVSQQDAKRFVDEHHAHNRAPAGWKFGAAINNGLQRIGVVMVGRPVARMLDATKVVEVTPARHR